MRIARTAITMLAALVLGFARPCDATPVDTCRHLVDRVGRMLVKGIADAEEHCLADRAAGRLPANTGCIGEGGATDVITDIRTKAKVDRLIQKSDALLERECDELVLTLAPPDGLGLSAARCPALNGQCVGGGDPRDCVVCAHVAAAHYLLSVRYPDDDVPQTNCPQEFVILVSVATEQSVPLGGVSVAVHYPPDAVFIPGSSNAESVRNRVEFFPQGGLTAVADLDSDDDGIDDELRAVFATTVPFSIGRFVTIAFCFAGSAPPLTSFDCSVLSAADDDGNAILARCSVELP